MKKIKLLIAGVLAIPFVAFAVSAAQPSAVSAQVNLGGGIRASQGEGVPGDLDDGDGIVVTVINILLYIIGIIAVIMLIFGGIKYATSAGDSNKVTSAKNTIMYAIVGLVIAVFAYALVNWVLKGLGVSTT